ncbi:MAG: hypothetical protein ACR2NZ_20405 [Rubripirellula sp.]
MTVRNGRKAGQTARRATSFNPSTSDDRHNGSDAFPWHNAYDRQGLTLRGDAGGSQSIQSEMGERGNHENQMESFKSLGTRPIVTYV